MPHGGDEAFVVLLLLFCFALMALAAVVPLLLLASIGGQAYYIWTRRCVSPLLLSIHGLIIAGLFVLSLSGAGSIIVGSACHVIDTWSLRLSSINLALLTISTGKQVLNRRRKTEEGK